VAAPASGKEKAPAPEDAAIGLVVTTARVASWPVRAVARGPIVAPLLRRRANGLAATGRKARQRGRDRLEHAAQEIVAAPEVERLVDEALAGPLPEAVARAAVEHKLVERLIEQVDEDTIHRVVQRVLDSPEFENALGQALSSPKVRSALTQQTVGFGEDIATSLRDRAGAIDAHTARGRDGEPGARAGFAGLASRGVAFVVDIVLAQILFLVVAGVVALIAAAVGGLRPDWLAGTLAGAGWALAVGSYFLFFWTLRGQTPGMRLTGVRVTTGAGKPLGLARAFVRIVGLALAIIPLFAGFLPVLFDRRRRALQDFLAGTVVRYD
jgi:uncharacterized RDD family membrane protein YckC